MGDRDSLNPDDVVRRIAEAGKGVRLGRGVVGKTGQATIALIGLWAIIIWKIGGSLMTNAFLLTGGLVVTGAYIWWARATQQFAERNPAQAMLEGAEFIEYKKLEAESKSGIIIDGPAEMDDDQADARRIGY